LAPICFSALSRPRLQSSVSEVRLDDAEVGEQLLGLGLLDAVGDNDILTGLPVDGGGNLVLVTELQGVDDAQNLGGVAAGGGRVGEDGADGLLGVDEEDGSDGQRQGVSVNVGGVLVVDPARIGVLAIICIVNLCAG
jgi:hypothetical protein